jgi:hypothetical protein
MGVCPSCGTSRIGFSRAHEFEDHLDIFSGLGRATLEDLVEAKNNDLIREIDLNTNNPGRWSRGTTTRVSLNKETPGFYEVDKVSVCFDPSTADDPIMDEPYVVDRRSGKEVVRAISNYRSQ